MTEQIKEPIMELRDRVAAKPITHYPTPKAATNTLHQPSNLMAIGSAAVLATALCLSAASSYLFFKELLIACSIIGMALLVRLLEKPSAATAVPNSFDPRLN